MTTGSYIQGSPSAVGPQTYKVWAGADWGVRFLPQMKFKDLPPIADAWGNVLTPGDGVEYKMALTAAKGKWLRSHKLPGGGLYDHLALHPYEKTHNTAFNSLVRRRNDGSEWAYESIYGSYSCPDLWSSNDDLKLIDKLREKILGSDLHAGVALVEVDRAFKMVRDDLTTLAWSYSALRRGNPAEAMRILFQGVRGRRARETGYADNLVRNAADQRLRYVYGYRPVMDDIDATLRYTAWKLNGTPISRVTAKRRIPLTVKPSYPFAGSDPDFTYAYSSARVVAYLKSVDETALLGLYDIPSMLWERTLFSFVADWVVPIGSYLSALNTVRSLTGKYVITRRVESQWRPAVQSLTLGPSYDLQIYDGLGDAFFRQFWIKRSVFDSLDVPYPSVKPAGKVASVGHVLNALALLAQKVGGRFTFL